MEFSTTVASSEGEPKRSPEAQKVAQTPPPFSPAFHNILQMRFQGSLLSLTRGAHSESEEERGLGMPREKEGKRDQSRDTASCACNVANSQSGKDLAAMEEKGQSFERGALCCNCPPFDKVEAATTKCPLQGARLNSPDTHIWTATTDAPQQESSPTDKSLETDWVPYSALCNSQPQALAAEGRSSHTPRELPARLADESCDAIPPKDNFGPQSQVGFA